MKKPFSDPQKRLHQTVNLYYLLGFLREFTLFSGVLTPFFTEWGHISLSQIQLLQSWFMLWIFLLEIPTGVIADYFGRKYSLAAGAFVSALGVIIYSRAPYLPLFFLGEFLFAAGVALSSGADQALLYDSLKELGLEKENKKIFGRAHSFHLLGIFLSAPLGSLIAKHWGLAAPLALTSIPFLLATLVALKIKEPQAEPQTSESQRFLQIARQGLTFLRRNEPLRRLALDAILVASGAYFAIWFYQPVLSQIKVPLSTFGFFHSFLVAIEILVSSNFAKLEKLFGGPRNYAHLTALLTGLSFFLVAFFPNLITIILLLIFAGGFGLTRIELMSSYFQPLIPSAQRATISSFISMLRRFFLTLLNPALGLLADRSLSLALFTAGLFPLFVFFFSPAKKVIPEKED